MFFIYRFNAWLIEKKFSLPFIFIEDRGKKIFGLGQAQDSHSGAQADLSYISDALPLFIRSLETTCKNVEPRFLDLGQKLESAYADATELTRQTLDTVGQIGEEKHETVLLRVGRFAEESLGLFRKSYERVTENLRHINEIIRYMGELCNMCPVIEKIALSLRVVGFSMSVESSRSADSQEMFGVVSRQISHLSENITEVSENMLEDARTAQTEQVSAYGRLTENLRLMGKLSEDARTAVQDSAREIEQLVSRSFEALEQAGLHSHEISVQVGEIVAGIQIHDSMSQRISHIVNALYDLRGLCTKILSGEEIAEKTDFAHSIAELQCAQLRQTISEIDAVYGKTLRAFEKIHSEVDLLCRSFPIFGSEGENRDATSEFTVLQSALSHLSSLLGQGSGLLDQIRDTAARASETGSVLAIYAEDVGRISFETHLVALNAIVRAAHLGHGGRTFEILAQEVKTLSDQSKLFTGRVTENLRLISCLILKTGRSCDQSQEFPLNIGLGNISRAHIQFRTESAAASQSSDNLKTLISQIISELDFFPALSRELTRHLNQLENIRTMLKSQEKKMVSQGISETRKLTGRYTMQQERGVHEQVTGQSPDSDNHTGQVPNQKPDQEYADDEPDDNDREMGDNVELF